MPDNRQDQDRRRRVSAARVLREGLIAGTTSGVATALAYLLFDWATGQPMRSAEIISALVGSTSTMAGSGWSAMQVVALLAGHLAFWIVVALIAAYLMGYADLHPRAWSLIFGGIALTLLSGLHVAGELSRPEQGGVPLWAGTLLGSGVMGAILMRRHTGIQAHFEQISLTPSTQHDLEISHQYECRSLARYRAAAERYPEDPILAELLDQSEDRVAVVEALFANYHCRVPDAGLPDEARLPGTPDEIYTEAIRDEEEKVSLYSRLLLSVNEERTRRAFSHLHWHASGRSLPILRDQLAGRGELA